MLSALLIKFFWVLLLPLVAIAGVLLWVSESREQRIRRWVQGGMSQAAVARAMNISRYQVRKALAAA